MSFIICFDCEFQVVKQKMKNYINLSNTTYNYPFIRELGLLIIKNNEQIVIESFVNFPLLENCSLQLFFPPYVNCSPNCISKIQTVIKEIYNLDSNNYQKLFMKRFTKKNQVIKDIYLKDEMVIKRTINTFNYLENLEKILQTYSQKYILVVKGQNDIIALQNTCRYVNFDFMRIWSLIGKNIFDIVSFNPYFRRGCESAKLIDTFNYVMKQENKYLSKFISHNKSLIQSINAHNPLSDALMTYIVYLYVWKL